MSDDQKELLRHVEQVDQLTAALSKAMIDFFGEPDSEQSGYIEGNTALNACTTLIAEIIKQTPDPEQTEFLEAMNRIPDTIRARLAGGN